MSTEYDEYDDLDASELPKKLRAKIKELQKEMDKRSRGNKDFTVVFVE